MMMRMDVIRRKFPEYGDMPDNALMQAMQDHIASITGEVPNDGPQDVIAIGVTGAIDSVKTELEKANKSLVKILTEEQKPDTDITPHFLALGLQLGKIETAIQGMCKMMDKPEPKKPEPIPICKSFKIKRDEIGNIESVIPQYS